MFHDIKFIDFFKVCWKVTKCVENGTINYKSYFNKAEVAEAVMCSFFMKSLPGKFRKTHKKTPLLMSFS